MIGNFHTNWYWSLFTFKCMGRDQSKEWKFPFIFFIFKNLMASLSGLHLLLWEHLLQPEPARTLQYVYMIFINQNISKLTVVIADITVFKSNSSGIRKLLLNSLKLSVVRGLWSDNNDKIFRYQGQYTIISNYNV